MAQCHFHWRRVLLCVCTPCITVALLLVYSMIMLCMEMNSTSSGGTIAVYNVRNVHFVASGTLSNKSFAPLPKTFWELNVNAFWNRLQLTIDRHFNPILKPKSTKTGSENSTFDESQLTQAFFEVSKLESTRRTFDQLPQQIRDFARHMHRRDYKTLLQPDGVCGAGPTDQQDPPLLLLGIKSTEMNFKNRQAIRQTWGQAGWVAGQKTNGSGRPEGGGYVRRVFLLGKQNTEHLGVDLTELLQLESSHYGDILQWNFTDTFFNLALKDVLFWRWFTHSCNQTRFVFKGDDDIFFNTPRMMTYLQDLLKKPQARKSMKDFMVGNVIPAAIPKRVNNSKYFIPESFYKGLYPMYAGGGGVVYSGLLTRRLHKVSKRVNLFPIDDVFVGMCMIRLNAHLIHHPAILTFDFPEKEKNKPCAYHTVLLVHKRSPDEVVKLWAHMKKTEEQCWDAPLRDEGQGENMDKL